MVYPIIPHRITVVNSGAFNDLSLCYTQTYSCSFFRNNSEHGRKHRTRKNQGCQGGPVNKVSLTSTTAKTTYYVVIGNNVVVGVN